MEAQVFVHEQGVEPGRVKPREEHAHHDQQVNLAQLHLLGQVAVIVLKPVAVHAEAGLEVRVVVANGGGQKLFGAAVQGGHFQAFVLNVANGFLLFIGGERKNGGHAQRLVGALLQVFERLVIELGRVHAADGKHGVKPLAARLQAVGFSAEVVQDVLRDFFNPLGVQQGLFVLGGGQLLLVLLGFNGLELRAHIVVVHLELEHLLVADGVGDHVRMQFAAKHAGGGLCAQGVFREDGRACEAKLIELLELFLQVLLRLAKLAAVALVKNEHRLLAVNGQIALGAHQVVELLDGGDDDLVVVFFQIALEACRAVRSVHAVGRKALVFLHGLVVQILAVHHKKHLVYEVQLGGQTRRLEAGQRFARARGVPNEAAALQLAPVLGLVAAANLPQNALGGGNLVGAHHQQRVAGVKNRITQQHLEQRVFLKERGREILQVLDQAVVRLRPVHGEVVAVFVALRGVGKVTAVSAVGNHKQLQKLEQRIRAVEALFAVAVHLVEGLANGHTALLQFHLHQRQAVDQNRHVIAVGLRARLLKLLDDLHLVAGNVLFVQQIDVLDAPIVKHKVVDVVVVHLAGLFDNAIAGLVQPALYKALPFHIRELHGIERLQLLAHIGQQSLRRVQLWRVFVALID